MARNVNKERFKHLGNPVFQHLKSDQPINVSRQRNEITNYTASRNGSEATLIIQPVSEFLLAQFGESPADTLLGCRIALPTRGGSNAITNIAKLPAATMRQVWHVLPIRPTLV